jgi:hypothetical protein
MNPIRSSSRAAQTARDLTSTNGATLVQRDFSLNVGSLTSFGMTAQRGVKDRAAQVQKRGLDSR